MLSITESVIESHENIIEERKKIVKNDNIRPRERVMELFDKFYSEFKETFDELKDR